MELSETTAYAHPADEVYEGQPAQIGEVEKNPHIHLTGTPLGILTTVLPVLIVLVLVYLVLIRPQRRADRTAKRLAESVKTEYLPKRLTHISTERACLKEEARYSKVRRRKTMSARSFL